MNAHGGTGTRIGKSARHISASTQTIAGGEIAPPCTNDLGMLEMGRPKEEKIGSKAAMPIERQVKLRPTQDQAIQRSIFHIFNNPGSSDAVAGGLDCLNKQWIRFFPEPGEVAHTTVALTGGTGMDDIELVS